MRDLVGKISKNISWRMSRKISMLLLANGQGEHLLTRLRGVPGRGKRGIRGRRNLHHMVGVEIESTIMNRGIFLVRSRVIRRDTSILKK